ncbi:MAG: DUF1700 domain-containing protein [Caulobacteraceae bacterium]|nr:DUF1700 domain-containing protein [Caulobacteraceae bacterium]
MNRREFMSRLRAGLAGLPAAAIEDIAADYEAHFDDAAAAGRSEPETAEALGDPGRLARELRAEASLKTWREARTPAAAASAVFAVLSLGAVDIIVLLPVLTALAGVLSLLFFLVLIGLVAGGVVIAASPFSGAIAATMLTGLGLLAGSISAGAVLMLVTVGLVNGLVWYGRLHYRLLKPAIEA